MKTKQILAKLLDYSLFFTLLTCLGLPFAVNCIFFFTLPVTFGLIEGVLLYLLKTTPGKWIFGIALKEKTTFYKSIQNSTKKGLLILPLFFPPLNLIFLYFYFKESPKHFEKRWNSLSFFAQKRNSLTQNLFIGISCLAILFQLLPSSYTSFKRPDFKIENWVEVKDNNLKFSVFFPEEPKVTEKQINVEEQNTTLDVTEYQHISHVHYTLHSTKVPATWTLLGSSYLLKALGKQIETHQGSFIESKISKHGNHPALFYLVQNHDRGQTKGALILVGKKVYKLEVMGDTNLSKKDLEISQNFISSFNVI